MHDSDQEDALQTMSAFEVGGAVVAVVFMAWFVFYAAPFLLGCMMAEEHPWRGGASLLVALMAGSLFVWGAVYWLGWSIKAVLA